MISNQDAEKIREQLNYQDRLIFDISLETGCRISDILKLRRNDISKLMEIHEHKTGKTKTVIISDELFERLHAETVQRGRQSNYAFTGSRSDDKHLDRTTYHRHLKQACRALEIDFSAHSTRKLYAQNVFDIKNDIFDVKNALQHEYITTTAAYLDIDIVQLINAELMNRRNAT